MWVFSRGGYSRASIDAIAAEAGVSTRTVYNYFDDKKTLFRAVILDSAEQQAQRQIDFVDRLLSHLDDLEPDLVAFGKLWAQTDSDSSAHFALIRQVRVRFGSYPGAHPHRVA